MQGTAIVPIAVAGVPPDTQAGARDDRAPPTCLRAIRFVPANVKKDARLSARCFFNVCLSF